MYTPYETNVYIPSYRMIDIILHINCDVLNYAFIYNPCMFSVPRHNIVLHSLRESNRK